jgi:Cu(I)-responsive transcriptional regulator
MIAPVRTQEPEEGSMRAKALAELADAKERGYYSIGRAAELSGVTAKMIRHYESLELIPKAARTLGDYRVYTASDIHKLRFVRRARRLGFSIDEVGTLLGLWQNERRASKEVKRLALKHVAELDSKIEELQSMRAALADLAAHCHGDHRPECPILDDLGRLPPSERN